MNKKKIDDLIQQELIEAVGYLRLSRDDGEDESTSITNQRAIITDWAAKNGFIITNSKRIFKGKKIGPAFLCKPFNFISIYL